jgi:SAM-dependent methyltransferase
LLATPPSLPGAIPRYVPDDDYTESFGYQWNRFEVVSEQEDIETFELKTGVDPRSLKDLLVLDAGCGGGRYARVAAMHGARVLGVDRSSAVNKARSITQEYSNAQFLQADLLDLPLRPGAFDLVYSIGVLHHTRDTRAAFDAIARLVRPGGRLSVWVYRKNSPPQEWINDGLRDLAQRMPRRALLAACKLAAVAGAVPLLNRTLNKVANFSNHPSWEVRVCDNFDWYSPRYQYHHTLTEVLQWFREAGFREIVELPPLKTGRLYRTLFERGWIVGSGVNVTGIRDV